MPGEFCFSLFHMEFETDFVDKGHSDYLPLTHYCLSIFFSLVWKYDAFCYPKAVISHRIPLPKKFACLMTVE